MNCDRPLEPEDYEYKVGDVVKIAHRICYWKFHIYRVELVDGIPRFVRVEKPGTWWHTASWAVASEESWELPSVSRWLMPKVLGVRTKLQFIKQCLEQL